MDRIKTGTAELGSVRFSWLFVFVGCSRMFPLRRSEIFVEPLALPPLCVSAAIFHCRLTSYAASLNTLHLRCQGPTKISSRWGLEKGSFHPVNPVHPVIFVEPLAFAIGPASMRVLL